MDTEPLRHGARAALTAALQQPLAVAATLLVVFLATRLLSGSCPVARPGKQLQPPRVPFWLPFFGHAPHMLLDTDAFLARLRARYYPDGVFSLRLFGRLHHFVHRPALANALLNRSCSAAEGPGGNLLISNFAFSERDRAAYHAALADDASLPLKHLLSDPGLGELVDRTAVFVKQHIADFVTFNPHPADQTDWERLADVHVVVGSSSGAAAHVEADLMQLSKNFIAKTANCALYGTDFVQNFPDFWQLMWTFDDAFLLLAANLPAWIPWPRLQRAKLARSKMLACTSEFNEAMDRHAAAAAAARWQDLDNVSRVVRARIATYRRHGLSLQARAGCDLAFLWGMNSNSNQLVPWMLFELYRDPVLLEQVREEVAPHVRVVQPDNEFGPAVWLPPVLERLDLQGLLGQCPLLKAAYIETLRVYTAPWTVRRLSEDVVLDDKANPASYLLEKGGYAHVSQDMHHFDPEFFPDPHEWHHERHLRETVDAEGNKAVVADMGTMRPYGGGPGMCKGRAFALREMLLYAAVIISFYDMEPLDGRNWEVPQTYRRAATRHPKKPIRVRIKRRAQPTRQSDAS